MITYAEEGTPGPWDFNEETGEVFMDDSDGEEVFPMIATVYLDNTTDEQYRADGHLIAAAPALRTALRALLDFDKVGDITGQGRTINEVKEAARAALNKSYPPHCITETESL